jgi:hypothetical protein
MFSLKPALLAATIAGALAASPLAAGTGAEGYFQIYNDTENNVVVGFYTNDGSGWSANWLGGVQIQPGESARAEFHAESGACEQTFAAGWLGSDGSEVIDDPIDIDICEASNVYLGDNDMSYD